ncbi:MAG: hypothetical protein P4L51_16755 [Puia sp.]|nr:hypothetical protein [Puia sp.]
MTKLILIPSFLLTLFVNAQKKAVTESGEEVILYNNGTWKYLKDFDATDSSREISTNPTEFIKPPAATFLLKAKNGNIGFWINPRKWTFHKGAVNAAADFELQIPGESLQATILSEATSIPLESFPDIALANGRLAAPDLKIVEREYRHVNGLKILHLRMEGTQLGIRFNYFAYYYSTSNSTIQFAVSSYPSTIVKYSKDVEDLLNGLTELSEDSSQQKLHRQIAPKALDSIAEGAYSPNNNCRKFFEGTWSYTANSQTIDIERTFDKTIEYTENKKYKFEYENRWLDDCKYEIKFIKTNRPNYNLEQIGEIITVEILEIDKTQMKYTAVFRGRETPGEMRRID